MPPSAKDLIQGGVKAGTFAATVGVKTAGSLLGKLKAATPFGDGGDDEQRFAATDRASSSAPAPAGERQTSSTGRFAREGTAAPAPAPAPAKPKPAAKKPAAAKPKAAGTATAGASSEAAAPKPVPRRISNPKAAKAVRKREKASHLKAVDAAGATGRGGNPVTIDAENVPTERAAVRAGKEPAPMGSTTSSE